MDKLFTVAGTSTLNGVHTYRFATGKVNVRTAKLKRHGHENVDLIELPNAMTKTDAVNYLVSLGRDAVIPTNRKNKPMELTEEQKAVAAKAEQNARRRAARAKAIAEHKDAQDAAFIAELTGEAVDTNVVPAVVADDDSASDAAAATDAAEAAEAAAEELLAAVGAA